MLNETEIERVTILVKRLRHQDQLYRSQFCSEAADEIERLRNVILRASNALHNSILCSGNDAQTNLHWVRRMEKELAPNTI